MKESLRLLKDMDVVVGPPWTIAKGIWTGCWHAATAGVWLLLASMATGVLLLLARSAISRVLLLHSSATAAQPSCNCSAPRGGCCTARVASKLSRFMGRGLC